jgi:hypothetical protein
MWTLHWQGLFFDGTESVAFICPACLCGMSMCPLALMEIRR